MFHPIFKHVTKLKANIVIFQHTDCSLFPLGQCCGVLFCNPNELIVFGAGKTRACAVLQQATPGLRLENFLSRNEFVLMLLFSDVHNYLLLIISILTSVCFVPKCKIKVKQPDLQSKMKPKTDHISHSSSSYFPYSPFLLLLFHQITSFSLDSLGCYSSIRSSRFYPNPVWFLVSRRLSV